MPREGESLTHVVETPRRGGGWSVIRWALRIIAGIVGLALLVAVAGAGYETIATTGDARNYPPPGQMVDVSGTRLHIYCKGSGGPAVIFDSGLGGTSLDWTLVQPTIARMTRACVYDRAGMGWSEPPRVTSRTPKQIATELHGLLQAAHVAGPYILVGHSLAGKNVRMFAIEHPDDVAGMVLVDARNEYMDFHITPDEKRKMTEAMDSAPLLYRLARIFGVARILGPHLAGTPALSAETRRTIAILDTRQKSIDAVTSEGRARAANDIELRANSSLGDKPLIVLASGENMRANANWRVSQPLQAKLSSDGRLVVASKSGHYIQWAEPGLVIHAIRDVVQKVRHNGQNPAISMR